MPNSVSIEAHGLRVLLDHVQQVAQSKAQDRTAQILQQVAGHLIQDLKETAPRSVGETMHAGGHLADMFAATPVHRSGATATVTITNRKTVGHWNLAELLTTGTRPHNIPNAFGWGANVGTSGRFSGYWHPGMRPNPFVRKSLDRLDLGDITRRAAAQITTDITG